MSFRITPEEASRRPAQIIPWPSIAAASAQLRRARRLNAVSARAANSAVRGRVTPLHPTTDDTQHR